MFYFIGFALLWLFFGCFFLFEEKKMSEFVNKEKNLISLSWLSLPILYHSSVLYQKFQNNLLEEEQSLDEELRNKQKQTHISDDLIWISSDKL